MSSSRGGGSGPRADAKTTRRGGSCCSIYRLLLLVLALAILYGFNPRIDFGSVTMGKAEDKVAGAIAVTETTTASTNKVIRTITDTIKKGQLENYRNGKALLLNIHATHHAGTSLCSVIGRSGGSVSSKRYPESSPSFACWFDKDGVSNSIYSPTGKRTFLKTTPVKFNDTDNYIEAMRPHFHMVSWEYDGVDQMIRNISETNWEHPDLVSVAITREPISRLMAGGSYTKRHYPGYNRLGLSHAGWWDYASNPDRIQTDNFFFRIIEGTPPNGNLGNSRRRWQRTEKGKHFIYSDDNLPTVEELRERFDLDSKKYEHAVDVLNRFTVVLDIACLDQGLVALGNLLNLNTTFVDDKIEKLGERRKHPKPKSKEEKNIIKMLPPREQIGYDDVYEYLLEKNKLDIKLYEYSKTISLVDCNN